MIFLLIFKANLLLTHGWNLEPPLPSVIVIQMFVVRFYVYNPSVDIKTGSYIVYDSLYFIYIVYISEVL